MPTLADLQNDQDFQNASPEAKGRVFDHLSQQDSDFIAASSDAQQKVRSQFLTGSTSSPQPSVTRAQVAKQTLSDYQSSTKAVGNVLKGLAYDFTVGPFVEAGKVLSGPSPTERSQVLAGMTSDERAAYLESGRGSTTPLQGIMDTSGRYSDAERIALMSPITNLGLIGALGTKSVGGVPHGFDRGFFTPKDVPPPPTRPLLALPPARPLPVTPEGQVVTPRTVGGVVNQMPEGQMLPFGLTPQEIVASQKRLKAPSKVKTGTSGITVTQGEYPEAQTLPVPKPAAPPLAPLAPKMARKAIAVQPEVSPEVSSRMQEIQHEAEHASGQPYGKQWGSVETEMGPQSVAVGNAGSFREQFAPLYPEFRNLPNVGPQEIATAIQKDKNNKLYTIIKDAVTRQLEMEKVTPEAMAQRPSDFEAFSRAVDELAAQEKAATAQPRALPFPTNEAVANKGLRGQYELVEDYLKNRSREDLLAEPYTELKRVGAIAGSTIYDRRFRAPTKVKLVEALLGWKAARGAAWKAAWEAERRHSQFVDKLAGQVGQQPPLIRTQAELPPAPLQPKAPQVEYGDLMAGLKKAEAAPPELPFGTGEPTQLHAGLPVPENVRDWLKRFSGRTPLAGRETFQRPASELTPPAMTRPPGMSEGQWIRAQRRPVVQPTLESTPPSPGVPSTPLPVSTPFQIAQRRIIDAIKTAKPVRAETERLYSQERGKRLGAALEIGKTIPGEEGFHAQLGQLRGELPKATFEPIRGSIDAETVKTLFTGIRDSRAISGFDQITAQRGLAKLLGDYGGVVPTRGELELLGRVFPPEFVKTVLAKRGLFPRLLDMTAEALAIPKSLMASMDLSASMRQGFTAIAPFPRQWGRAFLDQFRYFGSERAYESMIQEIEARPVFKDMRRSKLALSAIDGTSLTGREEQFMSTLPERIPGIGHMVRASDRAYTGFLTKLRADAFEEMLRRAQQAGTEVTDKLMADAAKYVNTATGRGNLGALEAAGSALSTAFFSPRLMASRFNMLNPVFYTKLDPFVRKQALKGALGTVMLGSTVLALAKAGGAKVGIDPRNADFGKMRVGNTRWDVWAGLSHFPRIASQLISGKVVSSVTGRTLTLGEGYKPLTRKDIIARFFENKANPVVGFVLRMLEGRSFDGKPIKTSKEVADLFTPMILQDMHDLYKDDPTLLPWATPAVFGVGVQTYGPKRAR